MLLSASMSPVRAASSEAELARLYEFVESGYRQRTLPMRLRVAVSRRVRSLLGGSSPEPYEIDRASAPDPMAAVYLPNAADFFVPVTWCRNVSLFGFGPGAFDAWEATARQIAATPDVAASDTVLARVLERFVPTTAAERLFFDPARDASPGSKLHDISALDTMYFWPWATAVRRWPAKAPEELRLRSHGPVGERIVELEVWRLKRLVASVKENGYRPRRVDGIRGQLLAANGEMRFLIKSGFHRVAVLAALGHDEVPVRFANGFQRLKTLDQLPTWPLVREGVFTPREAELVVERLFTEDGSLMAARLGFEPHPAGEAPPPAPRERPVPQPVG